MPSTKPGWRRPRLSIRAVMIGVAALALAFASIWVYLPWLMRRMRVNPIVDEKLIGRDNRNDLSFDPTYENYYYLTRPEYLDVLGDPRYVAERLLEAAARDADSGRRAGAFSALRRLLVEAGSPKLAQEFVGRVLRRAVAGALPPGDERAAVVGRSRLGTLPWIGPGPAHRRPGASPETRARSRPGLPGAALGHPHRSHWGDCGDRVPPRARRCRRPQGVHGPARIGTDALAVAGSARSHPALARHPSPRTGHSQLHDLALHGRGPPALDGRRPHAGCDPEVRRKAMRF